MLKKKKVLISVAVSLFVLSGQSTMAADPFSSVSSTTSSVTSSISSILDVSDIISSLTSLTSGLDDLLDLSNLSSITSQLSTVTSLAGCFGGTLPSLPNMGGICGDLGNLGMGGAGGSSLSMLSCVGIDLGDIGNLDSVLSSACSSATSTTGGGSTGGTTTTIPAGKRASSVGMMATGTNEASAPGDGTGDTGFKKVSDTKFTSGKSAEELYRTDGGLFSKAKKTNPSSSDSHSYSSLDPYSLILKEYAFKTLGTTDESKVLLPATKGDAIDEENQVASVSAALTVDHEDMKNIIVDASIKEYKNIDLGGIETVDAYRVKEANVFKAKVESMEEVKKRYKREKNFVDIKAADAEFFATTAPDYIFDPSEERAQWISSKKRSQYVVLSMKQQKKDTGVKLQFAVERKIRKEMLDITVKRAYLASSVFPDGVAKKEINKLLEAIDSAIQ